MTLNEGTLDRSLRVIVGALLLYGGFAFLTGALGYVVAAIGVVALATGLVGICPAYGLFHWTTRGRHA